MQEVECDDMLVVRHSPLACIAARLSSLVGVVQYVSKTKRVRRGFESTLASFDLKGLSLATYYV